MASDDSISYWDEEMASNLTQLRAELTALTQQQGLEHFSGSAVNPMKIREVENRARRIKNLRKTFVLEMRQLSRRPEKAGYQQKLREYDKQLNDLNMEIKWAKAEASRAELGLRKGGAGGAREEERYDRDRTLAAAKDLQANTKSAANRILGKVEDTKAVGGRVAEALSEQTAQLKRVGEDVTRMGDELQRADALMRSFARRLATDKCIWVFAVLLLIGLVVIGICSKTDVCGVKAEDGAGSSEDGVFRPPALGGGGEEGRRRLLLRREDDAGDGSWWLS